MRKLNNAKKNIVAMSAGTYHNIFYSLKREKLILDYKLKITKKPTDVTLFITICDEKITVYLHFREDENNIDVNNSSSRKVDIRLSIYTSFEEIRDLIYGEVYMRFLGFTKESETKKFLYQLVKDGILDNFRTVSREEDISGYDVVVTYSGVEIPIDITTNTLQKIQNFELFKKNTPSLLRYEIPILDVGGNLSSGVLTERIVSLCEKFIQEKQSDFLEKLKKENELIDILGIEKYLELQKKQKRKRKRFLPNRIFFNKSASL